MAGSIPINNKSIFLKSTINMLCLVLKLVAASAAKAELEVLFHNV
jgi:hypothetical protein